MDVEVIAGEVAQHEAGVTVLLCVQGRELPEPLAASVEADDFDAAPEECLVVYPRGLMAATRLVLVGLGALDTVDAERIRRAAAVGIRAARRFGEPAVAVGLHGLSPLEVVSGPRAIGEAMVVGLELGAYRYLRHKTGLSPDDTFEIASVTVVVDDVDDVVAEVTAGARAGSVVARAVNLARDLVNTPGAMKTPPMLAQRAVELGERLPAIAVTVLDEVELEEQGFGGILAVGNGSDSPPRFIIMEYGADLVDVPTVCVVGKGLTFDSGGLNIKPEDGMLNMKNDMGGSAAVFGVMQAVAELELPVHVVGLVPSAENMPSGRSYRPGDVVTTLSGTTVEILNTDAEGRVILSDGLHYAHRYEPDAIVELSTLTGAVIVALGNIATGVMATDQSLADAIVAAGHVSGDRGWQLPLWQEYRDLVKGDVGDLKNLAGRPAGSITAGAFLAAFVGDRPFAHLDIAGTAWIDAPTKPYQSKGATGAGVQMVTEYLRNLVG